MRRVMRVLGNRWLPFAVTTGGGLAIWALAAAHGYAWQLLWLPAVMAGTTWPASGKRTFKYCVQRLGGEHDSRA